MHIVSLRLLNKSQHEHFIFSSLIILATKCCRMNLHQLLPRESNWMWDLCTDPHILDIIEKHLGPNFVINSTQLVHDVNAMNTFACLQHPSIFRVHLWHHAYTIPQSFACIYGIM